MDPLMGIVGAVLVSRWSLGLLKDTSKVLLDTQAPDDLVEEVRSALEQDGASTVTDTHIWAIGPGIYSAALTVEARKPVEPTEYSAKLAMIEKIVHSTIEVHAEPSDPNRGR